MAQPIDKAFKILKEQPMVNMGSIRHPGSQSEAARMYASAPMPNQQFPESGPMPNSKEVQQLLLQMAQEKLQNPTFMQNMMEILNKPEGMDFARAAKLEYENAHSSGEDVPEDTY